jgi:hypothetical protein
MRFDFALIAIPAEGTAVVPSKRSTTEFLNVDLDIRVRSTLDELLKAMARRVLVLHKTEREASVELVASAASAEGRDLVGSRLRPQQAALAYFRRAGTFATLST